LGLGGYLRASGNNGVCVGWVHKPTSPSREGTDLQVCPCVCYYFPSTLGSQVAIGGKSMTIIRPMICSMTKGTMER